MPGALDGIRVLEFTQIIAGPLGGMLLSDMGAEVIKIEPVEGEPWRLHNEFMPKESRDFMGLNRGKMSLPVNLKTPEGIEIIHTLIKDTDVVIINARPDVPTELQIDYCTLSKLNPQLIYCDNTAFGQIGPQAHKPGYDLIVQALSGLLVANNNIVAGLPKQTASTAIADYCTGLAIAWSICAALYTRERKGIGQKIDTTLFASALAVQSGFFQISEIDRDINQDLVQTINILRDSGASYSSIHNYHQEAQGGLSPSRTSFRTYYSTYKTADGVIAIACLNDKLRQKAASIIGIDDPRFESAFDPSDPTFTEKIESVSQEAKQKISKKKTSEWIYAFEAANIPVGEVKFVEELLDDPEFISSGLIVELKHSAVGTIRMVGPLVQMSDTPLEAQAASPMLGEHTHQILSHLGYSENKVKSLLEKGVVR